MGGKQWVLQEQNKPLANDLAQALQIAPIVAQILINRGITTVEEGRHFFECDLDKSPDPFLMLGMEKAVARIQKALAKGETIVIYGDYDADGQTATALLVLALRQLAQEPKQILYYLPDRIDEGYGLNQDALADLSTKASLVITVDCGISGLAEIAFAKELGLDVIVTDHHEPGSELPEAAAILNPKQPGCPYPFKGLAGVGVAFKLVQGLGVPKSFWYSCLDFVALGTVADLVPLQGENRTLVYHGLRQMAATEHVGLKALLGVSEVKKPTASDLGFRLGPRLNAAGRMGDSSRGVRLLLTKDGGEALELALELQHENGKRQELEAQVLEEALVVIEKYRLDQRKALVVWGKGWHQGVVGIVASRLVERYYLPTVVFSVQGGEATASARSISGLDLYQTLGECGSFLTKYGGHAMAAGLTLREENLLAFQDRFQELCEAKLHPEDYVPKLYIDGTTTLQDVSSALIAELAMLEPHGLGNPGPLLAAEVSVLRTRTVGQENRHLQLTVQDQTMSETEAIAFGIGDQQEQMEQNAESIALAFVPGVNEWRNAHTIQLMVKDWQPRTNSDNYVRRWMVDYYPWRLGASYFQSRVLRVNPEEIKPRAMPACLDLRGSWDKIGVLQAHRDLQQQTLILVNTPAAALAVCRDLRIRTANDKSIGFEHEWLTTEERAELADFPPTWLVSTGYGLRDATWPSIWFWEPPLTAEVTAIWVGLLEHGGQVAALYGPKDIRELQMSVKTMFPDRQTLARIFTSLKGTKGPIGLAEAYDKTEALGLLGALPVAMGVFAELGLWEVQENTIVYSPRPPHKLDLEQAVLYNNITKMRKQSLDYLQRCLERGFFRDGLKREN